jgi:hypothetical protein
MSEPETTLEDEFEAIAAALREDAAQPDPDFERELGERVAAGFPRARGRRTRVRIPAALGRRWMPALAAAAGLVVVVAVALATLGGGSDEPLFSSAQLEASPATGKQGRAPRQRDRLPSALTAAGVPAPAAGGVAPAPAGGAVPPPAALPGPSERQVERSATLTLSVAGDELQSVGGSVGTVAESHGGYVLDSTVTTGDEGTPGGSFTLRVPTSRLETTLADLAKLGRVTARSETSQDVTAPYRHTQDRLGNALLELRALKLRLRRAADGTEADRIRGQIARVRGDVNALGSRMRDLRRRTQMSTVNVSLEQGSKRGGAGSGGHDSTGDAWRDAKHNLSAIANFLLRALGVLLPLAVLALLGALAGRAILRRRRDAALT